MNIIIGFSVNLACASLRPRRQQGLSQASVSVCCLSLIAQRRMQCALLAHEYTKRLCAGQRCIEQFSREEERMVQRNRHEHLTMMIMYASSIITNQATRFISDARARIQVGEDELM